uniref:Uncharacterized protein n=1 Tax=Aegilops tauschii subsp. strangulata TaxID=200361 RepID=A0A453C8E8_AEGTS
LYFFTEGVFCFVRTVYAIKSSYQLSVSVPSSNLGCFVHTTIPKIQFLSPFFFNICYLTA